MRIAEAAAIALAPADAGLRNDIGVGRIRCGLTGAGAAAFAEASLLEPDGPGGRNFAAVWHALVARPARDAALGAWLAVPAALYVLFGLLWPRPWAAAAASAVVLRVLLPVARFVRDAGQGHRRVIAAALARNRRQWPLLGSLGAALVFSALGATSPVAAKGRPGAALLAYAAVAALTWSAGGRRPRPVPDAPTRR